MNIHLCKRHSNVAQGQECSTRRSKGLQPPLWNTYPYGCEHLRGDLVKAVGLTLTLGFLLLGLSGCTNNKPSVLSQLPSHQQVQIEKVIKSGGNFELPHWLPFTPTGGVASNAVSLGRTVSNAVTVSLYDKSELLMIKPYEALPVNNLPNSLHLKSGAPASFQTTAKWSVLSWSNGPAEDYSLFSSRITDGNPESLVGPDLTQEQLVKVAESFSN